MKPGVTDEAMMGMGVESVRVEDGTFEIITPGAQVTLAPDRTLNVRQRIGADRQMLTCRLPGYLPRAGFEAPLRSADIEPRRRP